ncbi:hypothetical protein POPTR_008G053150v4 [Populus trichocarpa]|uniref:ACT domain-containing protein ACR n=1 Tax=Populus trichocarpa TaxID=3694 RepID=A0A3N7FE06_POPTR|nr:hypothetical protein POPTR_008G053150v4 [Populus trichocarpa]
MIKMNSPSIICHTHHTSSLRKYHLPVCTQERNHYRPISTHSPSRNGNILIVVLWEIFLFVRRIKFNILVIFHDRC